MNRMLLVAISLSFFSGLASSAIADESGPAYEALGGSWVKKSKGGGDTGNTGTKNSPIETNPVKLALNTINTSHPYIMLTPARIQQIKTWNESDPLLKGRKAWTIQSAINALSTTPAANGWIKNKKGNLEAILRNLDLARLASTRIQLFGLVYHLTGETRFADAARREMNALLAITSWDTDKLNMLTVAEANLAVSLAYDWLYSKLTTTEKTNAKNFITHKINMALSAYSAKQFWVGTPYNWGMVINSSMIVGSLAIADTNKDLAFKQLTPALSYVVPPYKVYGASGGYLEGTMYWEYATRFMAIAVDAMETAAKSSFDFSQYAEPSKAGDFKLYVGGPGAKSFDFGDSYEPNYPASVMFWLSKRYNQPAYAYLTRKMINDLGVPMDPLTYLWYDPRGTIADLQNMPASKSFENVNVSMLRTSWTDQNALSAGFKGANANTSSHCQLDGGTFVLDALGERWAVELGYTNSTYRFNTEGQNTLSFAGLNQIQTASSSCLDFSSDAQTPYAIYNLNSSNTSKASSWQRGMLIDNNQYALLRDEFTAKSGTSVVWAMHTRAVVGISGSTATLSQNGKTLKVAILQPGGATFSATKVPTESGITKLTINLVGSGSAQAITVAFIPQTAGSRDPNTISILPFSEWQRILNNP